MYVLMERKTGKRTSAHLDGCEWCFSQNKEPTKEILFYMIKYGIKP